MFNAQAVVSTFLLFFLLFCMVVCLEIGNRCSSLLAGILWVLCGLTFFALAVSHIAYLFVGA